MKTRISSILLFLSLSGAALASVDMEFVPVLYDANNSGGVGYNFLMGKYEVTANQWGSFVTAGGITHGYTQTAGQFDDRTWPGGEKPAVKISWYDAAQYCNWLTSGSTTEGAYSFNPTTHLFVETDRDAAVTNYSTVYVLPTLNEWNKAGYFNGSKFTTYANGTSTPPTQLEANYDGTGEGLGSDVWDVGSGAMEQNGTYDMMGNVWEWTENPNGNNVFITGGAGHHTSAEQWLRYRPEGGGQYSWPADDGTSWLGFRVAAIPEPTSVSVIAVVCGAAVFVRRWFLI